MANSAPNSCIRCGSAIFSDDYHTCDSCALAQPAPVQELASRENLVLVGAGALQMVINALWRDVEEGKRARGEMVDALLASMQPAPVQAGAQQAVYQLRAPLSDDWRETPMTAAMREACDGFTRWFEVSEEVHDRCRDAGTHKHRVLYAAPTQAGAGDAKGGA
ncbi:hypothetical protein [Variovorax boronicumulans]|uniref:hypothetical protein n=1 Tax=Variovorax boronicumulans TaxID=436515 RepID=UPI0012E58FE2|nr:hypothetical protein [Variovorax boronicumulans]GER21302.1 hypothetical protein VCH24_63490 [Variovorax boronicumulans]